MYNNWNHTVTILYIVITLLHYSPSDPSLCPHKSVCNVITIMSRRSTVACVEVSGVSNGWCMEMNSYDLPVPLNPLWDK